MYRKILSFVFLSSASLLAHSQAPEKAEWGIVAGINSSTYSALDRTSASIHPTLGLFARIPVSSRLSIDPRVFIFYGAGGSKLNIKLPSPYSSATFDTTTVRRAANYITLIAPLSYHFSPRFSVGLGPQVMILTQSHDDFRSVAGNDNLFVDSKYAMHQYDAGITGGITFQRRMVISLFYYHGLMYAIKQNDSPAKNSIFQVWIGIPFQKRSPN